MAIKIKIKNWKKKTDSSWKLIVTNFAIFMQESMTKKVVMNLLRGILAGKMSLLISLIRKDKVDQVISFFYSCRRTPE